MTLSTSTIKKLLHEHFPGAQPRRLDAAEKAAFTTTISQRLASLPGVKVNEYAYVPESQKAPFVCSFTFAMPSQQYYFSYKRFALLVNERQELMLDAPGGSAVVSTIDELVAFATACVERLQRQQVLSSKRQKVRDLKAQAIIAQVKQLARDEQLTFSTASDTHKLKLYVKLSARECIELHIPFAKFQDVLPHLRATILALRELHRRGIPFKLQSLASHRLAQAPWVTPETL